MDEGVAVEVSAVDCFIENGETTCIADRVRWLSMIAGLASDKDECMFARCGRRILIYLGY